MKVNIKKALTILLFICAAPFAMAQETATEGEMHITKMDENSDLKMYVIERNVEGIGESSVVELQDVTKRSCEVLNEMGNTDIQWVQSYFTGNKIYCHSKIRDAIAHKIIRIWISVST